MKRPLPIVAKSELLTGTVVPPASRKATPRATPNMPSVPMKGGTRKPRDEQAVDRCRECRPPATATQESEQHRPSARPCRASAQLMTWAATTAASPMMKPSDRSMPPEMMTKVWPVASRSGATAKIGDRLQVERIEDEGAAEGRARPRPRSRGSALQGTARRAGRRCAGPPSWRDRHGRPAACPLLGDRRCVVLALLSWGYLFGDSHALSSRAAISCLKQTAPRTNAGSQSSRLSRNRCTWRHSGRRHCPCR